MPRRQQKININEMLPDHLLRKCSSNLLVSIRMSLLKQSAKTLKVGTLNDIDGFFPWHNQGKYFMPECGLGVLDKLPLEILQSILLQIDLQSLSDFRCVNRIAGLMVLAIPQYKRILDHAPATIRGSLIIRTARYFSCQHLYDTLSFANCDTCGDFGGFVYLLTCRRVCYICFTRQPEFLPPTRREAIEDFGLLDEHLTTLPHMISLPATYTTAKLLHKYSKTLFDYSAVLSKKAADLPIPDLEKYVPGNLYTRSFQGKRFMAVVRAPHLAGPTAMPEWGFPCVACQRRPMGVSARVKRLYDESTFQSHIEEYGEIVGLEHTNVPSPSDSEDSH